MIRKNIFSISLVAFGVLTLKLSLKYFNVDASGIDSLKVDLLFYAGIVLIFSGIIKYVFNNFNN